MARRQRTKRKTGSPSPQLPVVNTTGFAALPYELYLEIMSYWPPLPVPVEEPTHYNSSHRRKRRSMMYTLSQSCRSLRRVFLGFLWERIEVYDGMVTQDGLLPPHVRNSRTGSAKPKVNRKYAEELVRQLETVTIRDPSLAEYVTILNVLVTDYSVKTVLEELARCIELLPNLHTVQLDFAFNVQIQRVGNTFRDYTYPQIRTVCLSPQASIFMRSCPNLRRVTGYHGRFWGTNFDPLVPRFANVETLGIIYAEIDIHLSKILDVMPKLRDITLDVGALRGEALPLYRSSEAYTQYYPPNLKFSHFLTNLRQLRTIRIKLNLPNSISYHCKSEWHRPVRVSQEEMDAWVKKARQVLSEIPDNSDFVQRKVILTRPNGEIKVFNVRALKTTDA